MCDYIKQTYNVPADIGRKVTIDGRVGVIAEDRGNYIGVNFDNDEPGVILNAHPTWKVEYLDMGVIRTVKPKKLTRSQKRYQEFKQAVRDDWWHEDFAAWLGIY